ncbi:MAG: N-6 DNA methylase [Candidatus Bathyarchaeia archaeon]
MKRLTNFGIGTPEKVEEGIPPGKIRCFIKGVLRNDTPEERVRQEVAKSLVEEYGYRKEDIEIEYPIRVGRRIPRVDIAIFQEGRLHKQENIYIIAETKAENIKPSNKEGGVDQLKSYLSACLNAKYGLWVGSERITLEVIEKEGRKEFVDIPDLPRRGEVEPPKPTKGWLVPAVQLKSTFKRIHNYIYANQGLPKDKAFEELLKLIFIKVYDERFNPSIKFYILPKEDIQVVRERLLEVFEKVKNRWKYIFKPEETIELNDQVLKYVVSELQRFNLGDTDVDIKGEAYEEIVGPNLRGDRGEFFTPRNLCRMTIDMLFSLVPEDKLLTPAGLKILDPAVGTGGFLIVGIQRIRQMLSQKGYKYDKLRDVVREIAETNFFGIDFNPFLVKVAQMNMVVHGDGSVNMVHANSLAHPSTWSDEVLERLFSEEVKKYGSIEKLRNYLKTLERPSEVEQFLSKFDIVVTNPPFGTKAVIDDPAILSQFEIWTFESKTKRKSLPPEQLFIERCLQLLKPGGILGMVVPDSILSNPGLVWIRKWILLKAYVLASIDLPTETFEPSTGTQTSILILKKKYPEEQKLQKDYEIFMAIPERVGHDRRGNPVYKLTAEGKIELDKKGQPVIEDHLPFVAELFRKWVRNEI